MVQQQLAEGAVGVQIIGNFNEVVVGTEALFLDRRHRFNKQPTTDLELLQTQFRAIKFRGRHDDLAQLHHWLDTPQPITVRCVTGRAGAGKTRLAMDLCEQAETTGWIAGFAANDELSRFCQIRNLTEWRWLQNTLVVVDYAAASVRALRTLLKSLARRNIPPDMPKLRLLLLDRHADSQFGWWKDLSRAAGMSGPAPDVLFDSAEPQRLSPLFDLEERRALVAEVMAKAAEFRHLPVAAPPARDVDPTFDFRLASDDVNNEPLYLEMAGLVAVETGVSTALTLTSSALAHRVAGAERDRLIRLAEAWGIDAEFVTHLAACVTLQGGAQPEAAKALVNEERDSMMILMPSSEAVRSHLADALPAPAGGIAAISPDLIGEAFVLDELSSGSRSAQDQALIVQRAWQRAGQSVVRTIVRIVQDYAVSDPGHASLYWLDNLVDKIDDPSQLKEIIDALPDKSVVLAERLAILQGKLVSSLALLPLEDEFTIEALAGATLDLSERLATLEQHGDALAQAEKAVVWFRHLASLPDRDFNLDLPLSLSKLAKFLAKCGRLGDAIEVGKDALAILHGRMQLGDSTVGYLLAITLADQASRLAASGCIADAIGLDETVLSLFRRAHLKDERYARDLGVALSNFSNHLAKAGCLTEALEAATEAKGILSRESVRRPDVALPDLCLALTTLANRLREADRRQEAVNVGEEMLRHLRLLIRHNYAMFSRYLWNALFNLAADLVILSHSLRQEDRLLAAVAYGEEAVRICRESNPVGLDISHLVATLGVVAGGYGLAGQHETALMLLVDGITEFSDSFMRDPNRFEGTMRTLVRQYLEQCNVMGSAPDVELLTPIAKAVQAIERIGKEIE